MEAIQRCCMLNAARARDGKFECVCGKRWEEVEGRYREVEEPKLQDHSKYPFKLWDVNLETAQRPWRKIPAPVLGEESWRLINTILPWVPGRPDWLDWKWANGRHRRFWR